MAAEATGDGPFIALMLAVTIGALILLFIRELYQRHRLWRYIAQDENQPDPLEILYCYRVRDVQNSETGGENR
ncbi:hypothetical protein [Haloarcula litorea]|uniref:hypothetical protein n=1 Tax=Haloarcula litorea TaxID=3032579 RepID=UPI0023E7B5AE|nr:hypothetical protein [Halomicroarcula sp. GDY20]